VHESNIQTDTTTMAIPRCAL